jgi:hypothetical protein
METLEFTQKELKSKRDKDVKDNQEFESGKPKEEAKEK